MKGVIRSKDLLGWLHVQHSRGLGYCRKVCGLQPGGQWLACTTESEWPDAETVAEVMANDWQEPFGDRRQELVFIGAKMNHEKLIAALDRCLLSDQEIAQGEERWLEYDDPFPAWILNAEQLQD